MLIDIGEVPCANGTVQLIGGPNEYEGRVEFCANGSWAQVCGGGTWGPIPASLVCLQNGTIRCELIFCIAMGNIYMHVTQLAISFSIQYKCYQRLLWSG